MFKSILTSLRNILHGNYLEKKIENFPDWTNSNISFAIIATGWMHQTTRPQIGDRVAVLDSSSMGMTIVRQSNHIIIDPYADQMPPKDYIKRVKVDNGNHLFLGYLRKYKKNMWVYVE